MSVPRSAAGVDVVVGGGHNGLVAACYLARAGREVVVLEALDRPGGGSRSEETIPGYRFDLHSAAHNIINMTDIPAELDLAGAGLVYQEMDPFSVAIHADGRRVRFHRSVEATVASALDDTLAPPGHHTVYLACPAAPASVDGGWPAHTERFVEGCLDTVEARAAGFRDCVVAVSPFTPDLMSAGGRWPGAHPMHLDIALDQSGPLRPTRALGSHRTPVEGLYISGAGTSPAGGIAGTPGRLAARAVLDDAG